MNTDLLTAEIEPHIQAAIDRHPPEDVATILLSLAVAMLSELHGPADVAGTLGGLATKLSIEASQEPEAADIDPQVRSMHAQFISSVITLSQQGIDHAEIFDGFMTFVIGWAVKRYGSDAVAAHFLDLAAKIEARPN